MRTVFSGVLSVFFLGPFLVMGLAAPAAADPIVGSWSGAGTAMPANGRAEPVRCRVTYAAGSGRAIDVSARCASAAGAFQQRGRVVAAGGNRYSGRLYNEQHNASGSLAVSLRGAQQTVVVTSARGTANITLRRH